MHFASIAEARAHFLEKGFVTVEEGRDTELNPTYVMADPASPRIVVISKVGFLNVQATEILQ